VKPKQILLGYIANDAFISRIDDDLVDLHLVQHQDSLVRLL